MKNQRFLIVVILIFFIITLFVTNKDRIDNRISIMIDNRLDYERSIEQGDEFNKIVWGNYSFQINHYKWGNDLDYVKDGEKTTVLASVKNYRFYDDNLYVISPNGFAVISNSDSTKIYAPSKNKLEFQNIQFLSSYDQFSEDEKKIFEKLSK